MEMLNWMITFFCFDQKIISGMICRRGASAQVLILKKIDRLKEHQQEKWWAARHIGKHFRARMKYTMYHPDSTENVMWLHENTEPNLHLICPTKKTPKKTKPKKPQQHSNPSLKTDYSS